ncbi:hypothetical protein SAMN05216462_2250 [Xylanibacter ruminicola]|uniref:Uncharacterized protein n=1 Tax=Xylanibacter ruminicola TaxID=839 RepID=A0A1H4DCP8_XYLRU|nr:hypothetical protein SAMN05216462_2250 [Xylanibacter ruminicola]
MLSEFSQLLKRQRKYISRSPFKETFNPYKSNIKNDFCTNVSNPIIIGSN